MDFGQFRKQIEEKISTDNYFSINNSRDKTQTFFWISVNGSFIGTTLCHYEFVLNESDNNLVNLEIHFEFLPEDDPESKRNSSALLGKYLLNKPIKKRYESVSKCQVGIIYSSFKLNSETLIQEAVNALEKMNNEFQSVFSKFIKKTSCKKILKKTKEYKCQQNFHFYGKIIYPCLLLILLGFTSVFIFIKKFSDSNSNIIYEKTYTENQYNEQDTDMQCEITPLKNVYKTINKWTDSFRIIIIISIFVTLITTIICFTVFSLKINNLIMKHNTMKTISKTLGEIEIDNADLQIKYTSRDINGNILSETDYYPQNKAIIDLFKAYTNAITDV